MHFFEYHLIYRSKKGKFDKLFNIFTENDDKALGLHKLIVQVDCNNKKWLKLIQIVLRWHAGVHDTVQISNLKTKLK